MADLEKIAEDLSSLTVLEAADLAKILEEKWGVSAAAPVAVAAAAGGSEAPASVDSCEADRATSTPTAIPNIATATTPRTANLGHFCLVFVGDGALFCGA